MPEVSLFVDGNPHVRVTAEGMEVMKLSSGTRLTRVGFCFGAAVWG